MMQRRTVIVQGTLAYGMRRLQAARTNQSGLHIVTLPQLAAGLAGGFLHVASDDVIEPAIKSGLAAGGFQDLENVRELPGMTRAVARTLRKAWDADLSLRGAPYAGNSRVVDLVAIEDYVRERLPHGTLLPNALRDAALTRIDRAPILLGTVRIEGVHFIEPVWRPLINALHYVVPIEWEAPPDADTSWFRGLITPTPVASLEPELVSCADPRHEAYEALRWVRSLLACGSIAPTEIAVCGVTTEEWDEHILALARDAELNIHFPHGIPCLTTRDGQRCAALADVILHGLSQTRVRRLFALSGNQGTPIDTLPRDWLSIARDASLRNFADWARVLGGAECVGLDWRPTVLGLLSVLEKGVEGSEEAADLCLRGRSRRLWATATRAAPVAALELTLKTVRVEDPHDPGEAVVWCPAWQLAAAPRSYVRLLGLTSRGWPRRPGDDPILPNHIVCTTELDSDPAAHADLRAFKIITAMAKRRVVLSRSRRTAQGSRITASPLFTSPKQEISLTATRVPDHALTESDRLSARPIEAAQNPHITLALQCWRDWHTAAITPHDGILSSGHPVVRLALARVQSATSLGRLLRDPIGFLWRYALGWHAQPETEEPLVLPPENTGRLVHELLRRTVDALEPSPGLIAAQRKEIETALDAAAKHVTQTWPLEGPVPPHVLWIHTVRQAAEMALAGLTLENFSEVGTRSWTEVPFGQPSSTSEPRELPWNAMAPVTVPGTAVTIRGNIDRLDLRAGGVAARVTDYKTGERPTEPENIVIAGGEELQRVLYALACHQLLPNSPAIRARLIYLKGQPRIVPLQRLEPTFDLVTKFVVTACAALESGRTVPGIDAEVEDNDLRFALPASPGYFRRKVLNFRSTNRELTRFWSVK